VGGINNVPIMSKKRLVLSLILAAILVIGYTVYSKRSRNHLNIAPDAERQIEKAKGR
jgi:hypothetical protein